MTASYTYSEHRPPSFPAREEVLSRDREPWDMRSSGHAVDQADAFGVMLAVRQGCAERRIPFFCDDAQAALRHLGLSRGGMLTNAAALLFRPTHEPLVLCRVYDSTCCDVLIEGVDYAGVFSSALDEASIFLRRYALRAFGIDMAPEEGRASCFARALDEALLNAFVHRDYDGTGPVVAVVSPGFVEISSPGAFLSGECVVSRCGEGALESLSSYYDADDGIVARNALLLQALYRFGAVDTEKTGMARIVSACASCGLRVAWSNRCGRAVISFERSD